MIVRTPSTVPKTSLHLAVVGRNYVSLVIEMNSAKGEGRCHQRWLEARTIP